MARKILLIDDDRLQFRLTQAHFKHFREGSFELEWANTYEAGLERLLSGDYAACLLDYQLGPRDGLQLIREAAARHCRTPIVFLTAESSAQVDTEAMNAGAMDYLVKGEISPPALERSLRYALKLGETLEALRLLATHDSLTGLLNRREFERRLAAEEERSRRFDHPLALLMLDVDQFKGANDRHGHPAGDAVLREVAVRLRKVVRSVDAVARFGGDEFALMLIETDPAGARLAADKICAEIRDAPFAVGGGVNLNLTVSVGASVLTPGGAGGHSLVADADKALYAAKAGGRDRAALGSEASA